MRPRRARLGYAAGGEIATAGIGLCFNEAEARTPRIRRRAGACVPLHAPGFNEAEARAPRMRGKWTRNSAGIGRSFNEAEARAPRMPGKICARCDGEARGFNEAEARAPRMPRIATDAGADHRYASMRPRRARLGCAALPTRKSPS